MGERRGCVARFRSAPAALPLHVGYQITPQQRVFWSFQPVRKLTPPPARLPEWGRNAIDAFILAKLDEKRLRPSPRAAKLTLIRRATYDLTGLPPSPSEVDAFLADRAPDAFAKLVDRLLASPAYGERWGRHWLDVARYSDTAGAASYYPIPQAYPISRLCDCGVQQRQTVQPVSARATGWRFAAGME